MSPLSIGCPTPASRSTILLDPGANATGLVAEGVDIKTAEALLGHSNAQLTLGLYAQAVVSLGAAAADSMAERFGLPARDGRAMERGPEGAGAPNEDGT